jgi:HAD superfamily phosphatase (TIGR01668 family)
VEKSEESGEGRAHKAHVFGPDRLARRLTDVPLAALWSAGFRGIIVDLDNTLVGYHENVLAPDVRAWVLDARARGFRLAMVSNNFHERVALIGAALDIPGVPSALKPLPFGFARALRSLGTSKETTLVVGDQLFTDVLGAKLFGLHAILTEPIVRKDHATTKILRLLERLVFGRRSQP